MALVKLQFKPGILSDGSRYSAYGGWQDGDKVRFRQGDPEKIGGWVKVVNNATPFIGTARLLVPWSDLSGNVYLGIGTSKKFYVESGGANYDITPIRRAVNLANPFTTTAGSTVVTVVDASNAAVAGDTVTFSGASAVGGLTLNGAWVIQTLVSANSYTIISPTPAATGATGGGAVVAAAYEINVGLDTSLYGTGYGAGTYGGIVTGGTNIGYGSAANVSVAGASLRLWSADNFGQDLVFNQRDGAIFYWAKSGGLGTRGVLLSSLGGASGVPTVAKQVLITDQDRRVFAFGATDLTSGLQDPLLIRWTSSETPLDWTPTDINSAGDIRIPGGTEFITAKETKAEVLVWTDEGLYSLRYVGAPFIYGISRVGSISIIAPNVPVAAGEVVFWMGAGGFYRYDGSIRPLVCPVKDTVFKNMNLLQAGKFFGGSNMSFNEVWWFYVGTNDQEISRYVVYNYVEDVWTFGSLVRTTWLDRSIEDYPRATGTDGFVYYHEYGTDDGSANPPVGIPAFIESGPVEIGEGERFGFAWRLIPDLSFGASSAATPVVTMTLEATDFPGRDLSQAKPRAVTRTATLPIETFTAQSYFRLRGRALSLRVASDAAGVEWRLGVPRIDVRPDGTR